MKTLYSTLELAIRIADAYDPVDDWDAAAIFGAYTGEQLDLRSDTHKALWNAACELAADHAFNGRALRALRPR